MSVVHVITTLDRGGAESMLAKLVGAMDDDRFENRVVTLMEPGPVAEAVLAAGVTVESLGLRRGVPKSGGAPSSLSVSAGMAPGGTPDLALSLGSHRNPGLARPPPLGDGLESPLRRRGHANLQAGDGAGPTRAGGASPDGPTQWLSTPRRGAFAHEKLGYAPERWEVIPNGFDTDRFSPDADARRALRGELGVDDDAIIVCLPARWDPAKDHATFVAAAGAFSRARSNVRFPARGRGDSSQGRPASPVCSRSTVSPRRLSCLDLGTTCRASTRRPIS